MYDILLVLKKAEGFLGMNKWDKLEIVRKMHQLRPRLDVFETIDKIDDIERSLVVVPDIANWEPHELIKYFSDEHDLFGERSADIIFRLSEGIDKGFVLDIFDYMNYLLIKVNIHVIIHVYGGCAVMLMGSMERRSGDFDFVFETKDIRKLSGILRETEDKFGLPHNVFDKTMGPLITNCFIKNETVLYREYSNLHVRVCNARQLLAMKLFSARLDNEYSDLEDAYGLCMELDVKTRDQMLQLLYEFVLEDAVTRKESSPQEAGNINRFISRLEHMLKRGKQIV